MNAKIYPTMITPFNEDRSIDYNGVAEIIEWYIENGCDGSFAICQSSEMFYMSLSERLELAKFIVDKAKGRLEIVASGHISSSLDAQIEEMKAIAKTNVKAIVFVSNRFADSYENDDIWLNNMKRVIDSIDSNVEFGIYECPYPYKRVLSDRVIEELAKNGRFTFIKDTCCDLEIIKRRADICNGSNLKLYNANASSLLYSLQLGYYGYSGVMANFYPDLYVKLLNSDFYSKEAKMIENFLLITSYIEKQNYPKNAKYYMNNVEDININSYTRTLSNPLNDLEKLEIKSLKDLKNDLITRLSYVS